MDWSKIKDTRSLVLALREALLRIFGNNFIDEEVKKFKEYSPKGKPGTLAFLRPCPIHRVAKWFMLLESLKERGCSFDLRFSAGIEEFMWLLLFSYSIDLLVKRGILQLTDKQVEGALKDSEKFESLMYEVLVATNYAFNNYEVELPNVLNKGKVDVHAWKGYANVFCECKRLRRRKEYVDIAIEVIEHLLNPDYMLREVHRVLKDDGIFLISTPNLASWVNRLILLLGYQPYNAEVSTEILAGVPWKAYSFTKPSGHIRPFTLRGLRELLEYHGFHIIKVVGVPGVYPKHVLFQLLDKLFAKRPSLAQRLIVLARKSKP